MRRFPKLFPVALSALLLGALLIAPSASGQNGPDTAAPEERGTANCTKSGDKRDNLIKGTPKRDVICGGAGNDTIRGLNGDDRLLGGPGRDTIYGGDGNDNLDGGRDADKCKQGTGRGERISCGADKDDGGGGGGGGGGGDKGDGDRKKKVLKVCPVPKGTVYNDFGDDRGDHRHQGNDIIAKKDAKVLATFPGTMENLNASGAGKYVQLTGKDGYTFGMHLSDFARERKVRTGDVIGYVGSTGNAGSTNHLHFEWHPKGGRAVDPFPLLNKVCKNTVKAPEPTEQLAPIA